MEKFITDQDTGLPQLPEDHFWRVEERLIHIMKLLPDLEFVASNQTDPELYHTRFADYRKMSLDREPKTETYRTIFGRYKQRVVERWVYRYWEGAKRVYTLSWEYVEPNNPDNLWERCCEVLEKWERQQRAENTWGDYPPKKHAEGLRSDN